MKKIVALFLLLAVLLSGLASPISALAAPAPKESAPSFTQADLKRLDAARLRLLESKRDILGGLTQEQMREDLDSLWGVLKKSYPFLGVAKRQGIDPQALYEEYRKNIAKDEGDIYYANYMRDFIDEFKGLGHLKLFFESATYDYSRETYKKYADTGMKHSKILYERLMAPRTVQTYKKLAALEQEVQNLFTKAGLNIAEQGPAVQQTTGNAIATILTPKKTAYLKINSFGAQFVQADVEALWTYYRGIEADGIENLIIDITGNGGGSDQYWQMGLVYPNIAEPLKNSNYLLFPDTADVKKYLGSNGIYEQSQPISQLPELPRLNPNDKKKLDRFVTNSYTIPAQTPGKKLFSGKIWVLVDERVYSASETFAMFCKNTGFATLVGVPTGGDGGGIDPMIFTLPHSGLVYRFSVLYSINSDGTSSEEFGTTPDILTKSGESPLTACLAAIDGKK